MGRCITMMLCKNILFLWMLFVPCQSEQDFSTICKKDMCTCDGFGKVICRCTNDDEEIAIRLEAPFKMLPTAIHIGVDNCQKVTFMPNAITNLQELRSVKISNVKRLYLSEKSLHWAGYSHGHQIMYPGVNIEIQNTTIFDIPSQCVKGHIDEILINSSSVLNIKPFAFSDLIGTKKIEIIDSNFSNVENQAFKKISLDYLFISGGYFKVLPSRMFSDLEVRQSLKLSNVNIDKIRSSAFIITGTKKTLIENCRIGIVEGDAFRIVTRGSVAIRNNVINQMDANALAGIGVSKEVTTVTGKLELLLENNTIISFEKDTWKINMTSFDAVFKQHKINKTCDCLNTNYMMPLFKEENVWCVHVDPSGHNNYVNIRDFNEEDCSSKTINKIVLISIIVIVCVVLGAGTVVVIFILKLRKRRQVAWVNGIKPKDKDVRKLPIILPDGRTYRETELHVFVEKAELLTTDL